MNSRRPLVLGIVACLAAACFLPGAPAAQEPAAPGAPPGQPATAQVKAPRPPREVTAEERRRIEAALPSIAPAKPKRPRKLLVIDANLGRSGHPAIPFANLAVELLGKRTGVFEATITHDISMLEPETLFQYDALYLNNTIGDLFDTPSKREGLLRFLREGRGLMANHAATVTSTDWPEFGEILGARGASHREQNERLWIKIDAPGEPLTAPFGTGSFEFVEEFFRFQEPYSRQQLRVLLSIDVDNSDLNQGKCAGKCFREDNDYAVSWVRRYGNGRVFYTSFGHGPEPFFDPRILQHWLAGLQFVLGDLEVSTEPSAHTAQALSHAPRL